MLEFVIKWFDRKYFIWRAQKHCDYGEINESIFWFEKTLEICNGKYERARIQTDLSLLHYRNKDYRIALRYADEALKFKNIEKYPKLIATKVRKISKRKLENLF
ncbi:MAG: hypothetical protein U9Q69_00040 [Nanoarchaeota archaeon]|nr:hypothetical protein [Nanoarchaeota archaeon]